MQGAAAATTQHDRSSPQPLPLPVLTNHLGYPALTQKHLNLNFTQLQAFIVNDAVTPANTDLITSQCQPHQAKNFPHCQCNHLCKQPTNSTSSDSDAASMQPT